MRQAPVLVRDLVFVGGGHAHALALLMWGMRPLDGVRLTVINPHPTAPYSGMLPGHVAGHYSRAELEIDLVRLARFAGARLLLEPAVRIDPEAREVELESGRRIAWDVASIDVGIHAEMPEIAGFSEHGIGVKPLDVFAARWQDFLARALAGEVAPEVAVIGGGVAGVELALAMAHALQPAPAEARVTIIEAGPDIVTATPGARAPLRRAMARLGVRLAANATVARVGAAEVALADGRMVPARFTLGAAGARAHAVMRNSPLPLTEDGFVRVGPDLRVEGQADLFAVGDCAHMGHAPRPKAGVFAVRAAPVLLHNLRARVTGGRLRPFRPQKHYLKLMALGGKSAIAEKWGRQVSGPLMWRWKDRIDRKFMAKFNDLPEMAGARVPAHIARVLAEEGQEPARALCGGCGSKVAPGTLAAALARLPLSGRADVLSPPGDDAAILALPDGGRQVLTTDHLRAFTEDPALMARIATVHALGDIWAMGAQPQAGLLSVTLPRMSQALQARSMEEILAAVAEVLEGAGAALVGGHSSMGAELAIGLTLSGLVAPEARVTELSGARPGDALVLSRPIGSGTILAAEMQGRADGRDVAGLLARMARPQGDAAAMLIAAGAHAMTDVTGFGLAGHLLGMCRASGVAARLELEAIPIHAGALELAAAGVRSTIWAANRAAAPVAGAEGARGVLLHDPQTAGGMLAALPEAAAAEVVARLGQAGHVAARIGWIVEGAPALSVA